jgi:hypothetical protein
MVFPVFTDFALDTAREIRAANLPHLATVESFSTSHQRGGGTVSDPVILAEGEPCCMRSPGATPQERAIADQLERQPTHAVDFRAGFPVATGQRVTVTGREPDGAGGERQFTTTVTVIGVAAPGAYEVERTALCVAIPTNT